MDSRHHLDVTYPRSLMIGSLAKLREDGTAHTKSSVKSNPNTRESVLAAPVGAPALRADPPT